MVPLLRLYLKIRRRGASPQNTAVRSLRSTLIPISRSPVSVRATEGPAVATRERIAPSFHKSDSHLWLRTRIRPILAEFTPMRKFGRRRRDGGCFRAPCFARRPRACSDRPSRGRHSPPGHRKCQETAESATAATTTTTAEITPQVATIPAPTVAIRSYQHHQGCAYSDRPRRGRHSPPGHRKCQETTESATAATTTTTAEITPQVITNGTDSSSHGRYSILPAPPRLRVLR
jgi:hypothetical protein